MELAAASFLTLSFQCTAETQLGQALLNETTTSRVNTCKVLSTNKSTEGVSVPNL